MFDSVLLYVVAGLILVLAAVCLRIVSLWKVRMREYLCEKVGTLELTVIIHADEALQGYLRDNNISFNEEMARVALNLICHASVLKHERELTYVIPQLFGARRAALGAYAQHLEDMNALRKKLKGMVKLREKPKDEKEKCRSIERSIEMLAQTEWLPHE